ncbi:aminocarboxymuconate-semialdehyde decarboxylase [Lipingzhangella halophila]|uniref:Aminocarboxymuconate-semialdehyde decarboxylase n=1 Tax=Lipingzhangella halophila TaxID=1783352 RepID=A0A7W7RNM3_9ACTN|nr:amidohydrolase family protein [Lipingzhangella halophila]MBB4935328.1 aminocarboxymuconate-semialdehyde decarboxylase [Lipingzhangella halophila]
MLSDQPDQPGPPTVDAHAHVLLPTVESLVGGEPGLAAHRELDALRNGAEAMRVSGEMIATRWPRLTDVDTRLADMDAAGVDIQILSPSPSHYHYWAGPDLAQQVTTTANEAVAEHCAKAPDRLRGIGLAPLQHPGSAVAALEHAVAECGLAGVEISSHAPEPGGDGTVELSDPRLEQFWARAAELNAVVFLHPFGCTLGSRLDRWYLSNIAGQPVENAVALSHLIFSGVLDRHPELRLLAAHGGGYLPTHLGRADHGWEVRPDARGCAEPPSSYLPRLWFDSLVHTPEALRALVAAVGADRVVLGSDHPFDMGVDDPVARLEQAGLPESATRAIRGATAAALFALEPTTR